MHYYEKLKEKFISSKKITRFKLIEIAKKTKQSAIRIIISLQLEC